ncbi:MAG TPA: recombination-associated protein RdgC [Nevskia sp.]|nr:recombination-associated protein RdgC [Nevskia sp.]
MSTWFKNLFIYSLDSHWKITPAKLEEALAAHPLLPCSAASMQSQGWVAPHASSGVVYSQGKQVLVSLGMQQRLLPAAVINQTVKQRAAALEKTQGFAPGRKQLRDLKDRVTDELRPRAFVREKTLRAWLDLARHRLIVDTSSAKIAENLATALRNDLGELPAIPLATQTSPGEAMTTWLSAGSVSAQFSLDQDCELVANELQKSTVRYVRHGLEGNEIRSLIQGGKSVSRVGLVWRDRLSLVLNDKLEVKRLRFEAMDAKDPVDGGKAGKDDAGMFEANFTLMTGELTSLIDDLVALLGGPRQD